MNLDLRKLFIVDDDEMLSMMLSDHLSGHNFEIDVFETGEKCLDHIDQTPDIIILDYNLNSVDPDAANGLQILKAIKEINKEVLIIMYSSQEQYGPALDLIREYGVEYLIKDDQAFSKIENIIINH
jgi:DNA-binding response OmpR family regulator